MTLFQDLIKEDPKQRDKLQRELLLKIQKHSRRKTIAYLANFKNSPHKMIKEYYYRWELLFNTPTPVTKIFQNEAEFIVKNAPVVFISQPVRIPQPLRHKKQKK